MFSLCPPLWGGGTPSQVWMRGGGTRSHVQMGYPIPGPVRRYPILLMGGTLIHDPPIRRMGYLPSGPGIGYPCPGLDWLPPPRFSTGWSTPFPIRRQISKASTCYEVSGVPFAFTQENVLVFYKICRISIEFHQEKLEWQRLSVSC